VTDAAHVAISSGSIAPSPDARMSSHSPLTLREARGNDSEAVRAWRNDPTSVRFSATGRPVTTAEHEAWFANALASEERHLWIGELDGEPVGQVRVDVNGDAGVVHIALAPERRGRGLGPRMLDAAVETAKAGGVRALVAIVHRDNVASHRAFAKAGFRKASETGDFVRYERMLT
jgi:RimJ/RimL family protein N-acetyltransferase